MNELIGLKFGKLEVVDVLTRKNFKGRNRKYCTCRCDCGNI